MFFWFLSFWPTQDRGHKCLSNCDIYFQAFPRNVTVFWTRVSQPAQARTTLHVQHHVTHAILMCCLCAHASMLQKRPGMGVRPPSAFAFAQSSCMFTNVWGYELAWGGPHTAMNLMSLSLHTNPAVLSMQMRAEKRGGLSWVCSVSASLLLHFKWINDKSPLSSQLATVLSHSRSLFIYSTHSLTPPQPLSLPFSHSELTLPLSAVWLFSLFFFICEAHINNLSDQLLEFLFPCDSLHLF